MPTSNTASFQAFLQVLARKFARQASCWFSTARPTTAAATLSVPDNIALLYIPPYSPELNPKKIPGMKSAKNLQELCTQILYRSQSQARPLPYLLPHIVNSL
jgi:hypothetical protein